MKPTPLVFSILVLVLISVPGCAYTAHVRGVAGDDPGDRPSPGVSINVSSDPNGTPREENPEITRKIEKLLGRKGFAVTNSTEAEYYLFFEFERDSLMNRIRFEPFSGLEGGIHTTRKEGPYDLALSMRLVRAADYHETGMETFVWTGGAVMRDVPTESSKFTDLLLVAAMRAFPFETGKTLKVRLPLHDSVVRSIHEH